MKITKVNNQTFVTDWVEDKLPDVVFPIFEDESVFFAKNLEVKRSDSVLDIGTGSGVLGITAALKAKQVTCLDLQDRALQFARFNAYLNGVEGKIKFVKSDGLAKINGKFDLILFNPPFNPAPKDLPGKIFSHGGTDGTYLIKKVFSKISQIAKIGGRIQMITFSLGRNGKPIVFDLLEKYLSPRKFSVRYTHVYPPTEHKKINYFEKIFGRKFHNWYGKFQAYPEIYYIFMTIDLDTRATTFQEERLTVRFKKLKYSASWQARIRRLRNIYRGI